MTDVLNVRCIRRDNVPWDDEQESAAAELIDKQRATPVTPEEQGMLSIYIIPVLLLSNVFTARLNATPAKYWDKFYANVYVLCTVP